MMQRVIAASLDIRLDPLRIDPTAVLQDDGHLPREAGGLGSAAPRAGRGAAVQSRDDRAGLLGLDPLIQRPARIPLDQRTLAAQTHAADGAHLDAIAQTRLLDGPI